MTKLIAKRSNITLPKHRPDQVGFILPIIIIIGLIIGAGLIALSARTIGGLLGSIRQGQGQQAREVAEKGIASIITDLNRKFPYLLIESCQITSLSGSPVCAGWSQGGSGTFAYRTSLCPNSNPLPQEMLSKAEGYTTGGLGRYRLVSYTFSGDQNQGGVARIKVMGQRLLSNGGITTVRATAFVDQELSILPKNCNVPVNQPSTASGFPGLLAETVSLGNNDVFGSVNGNVLCTTCDPNLTSTGLAAAMNLLNNGIVTGNLFGGQIAMPPVQTYPSNLPIITPKDINNTTTFNAGSTNDGTCNVDSQGITHCQIGSINLSGGKTFTINTTGSKGLRLYVNGNISMSGSANLAHTDATAGPTSLGIFGKARTTNETCSQQVSIGGGSTTTEFFLYFPDGCVGINGGSSNPDIRGAVWARTFNGSSSNNAEVEVPNNMGSLLFTTYGSSFSLGIREFAALGVNKWQTVQLP